MKYFMKYFIIVSLFLYIYSLFTNVPVQETIEICSNALYDDDLVPPPFPRKIFIKLMQTATSSVEFSFNDTMYRQTDGLALGSQLGPALANIFDGYQETKLFLNVKKPLIYYCYVDDIFAVFENEDDFEKFLSSINFLHSSLRFTFEKELKSSLPFLDILVEKHKTGFITSVCRKPTFTGQYIQRDSFSPKKQKINHAATLVNRALFICSCSKLQAELDKIRSILVANGYPNHIITSIFSKKIRQFNQSPQHSAFYFPVETRLVFYNQASSSRNQEGYITCPSPQYCYLSICVPLR